MKKSRSCSLAHHTEVKEVTEEEFLRGVKPAYGFGPSAVFVLHAELLGIEPYFEVPGGYAEFCLGDYQHELGLIDNRYAPKGSATGSGGAVVFWHVDDVTATLEKLLSMGAKEYEAITDRGEGFITASMVDPFGNILGIMYKPHYLEVLGSTRKA